MIHIDFETRSTADLKAVGVYEYAADPTTDVICMAWAIGDSDVEVWTPGQPMPPELVWGITKGGAKITGWNVSFERTIWNSVCIPKYGWPEVKYHQWECTMARAAACGLPQSLEMCAKTIGLDHQKDTRGKRVMLKCAKPRKVVEGGDLLGREIIWWEDPVELATVYRYCAVDVMVERDACRKLPALSPREQMVWTLDQMINDRGLEIDRELCQGALTIVESKQDELAFELKVLTGWQVESPTAVEQLKTWLAGEGVQTETLGASDVERLLTTELPDHVRRALEIRQQAGKSSTAKYEALLARSKTGRMRGNLRYYGAATGRWSGSGAQIQNFPRGSIGDVETLSQLFQSGSREMVELFFGDPIEAAKSALRSAIVAPEGKMLLVWDYAQIEARVLAWLANETSLVKLFAEGKDVYKAFASKVYGKPEAEVTKGERFIAKTMVLGLGYGMGATKFQATLAGYGVEVSEAFALRAVETYRDTFKNIVRLWYSTERDAVNAVGKWRREDGYLKCLLPSGRDICYYGAEVKESRGRSRLTYKSTLGVTVITEETYGGKLVENIVQGIARDVLVDGMFELERAGIPIDATVHDEVIAESERDRLEEGIALLTKEQAWRKGLPLAVEGFVCRRYRK
jgi:DNA polymerase